MSFQIKPAVQADVKTIYELTVALALYEKKTLDQIMVTEEKLNQNGFEPHKFKAPQADLSERREPADASVQNLLCVRTGLTIQQDHFVFSQYHTRDNFGRTITFYLLDASETLPLLVYVRGSGGGSVLAAHPYSRWYSYCNSSPLENLLKSKAKAYIVHGTMDTTTPVVAFDVMRAELMVRRRQFVAERIEGADHAIWIEENGNFRNELPNVIARIIQWCLSDYDVANHQLHHALATQIF